MRNFASTRRYWLPQLIVLGILALLGTLPFWLTDLDIELAAIYYHPDAIDPWHESQEPLWTFFYQMAPLISALLMLGGLAVLVAGGMLARLRRLRIYAVLVILVTVLGPGLLVNAILKENLGRPRPHQLVEFGDSREYLPPLAPGVIGEGKSFPCGHSSVGYLIGIFGIIWLRRRPLLAAGAFGTALVLGTVIGIGRMTAGDHFVSDIIWSAVIVYGLGLALYYFVLRIPEREDAWERAPPAPLPPPRHPRLTAAGYLLTAGAMVTGVLLATPVNQTQRARIYTGDFDPMPRQLRLEVDEANVVMYWTSEPGFVADTRLKARGFGLPGTRVKRVVEAEDGVLRYRLTHSGVYTEKDTKVTIGLPPEKWDRVEVRVGAGDIRVNAAEADLPELDLVTNRGKVIRP